MSYRFSYRHLLDIESLSRTDIEALLDLASLYAQQNCGPHRKSDKLHGKTVVNLFMENSTRTRTSFEIAAKRLGADVVNVPTELSSTKKGETLLDTVLNLDAMLIDALIIRHSEDGMPHTLAEHMKAHVINAGDGKHEHPTQALLDALTILRHKKTLQGLTVVYCGDLLHSRVAGSFIHLMSKFNNTIRAVAPPALSTEKYKNLGVELFDDIAQGIKGADVVMTQRVQRERLEVGEFSMSTEDYHQRYGLNHERLAAAKADAIVMNPGPVIRGSEITTELTDDPVRSVILEQVEMGVAVRMAVMDMLMSDEGKAMKAFAPLAPEFYCSNFDKSLSFYTEDLGFEILYLTVKEGFAYLDRQGAQIMIEEPKEDSDWLIERPTYPFGRGVNFKMYTHNALELYESLKNKGYSFVRSLKDDWYPKDDIYVGNRQFIIQDPDGYLLRFAEDLGTKTTDEAHTIEISK